MKPFEPNTKVRINEGELEGIEGTVFVSGPHVTSVRLDLMTGEAILPVYTEMLVSAEDHPALAHLKGLYPDFLKAPKSDNYRFRLTTYVHGIIYVTYPLHAEVLKTALAKAPAGLEKVEFMLKQDDPGRGLAWKLLWNA